MFSTSKSHACSPDSNLTGGSLPLHREAKIPSNESLAATGIELFELGFTIETLYHRMEQGFDVATARFADLSKDSLTTRQRFVELRAIPIQLHAALDTLRRDSLERGWPTFLVDFCREVAEQGLAFSQKSSALVIKEASKVNLSSQPCPEPCPASALVSSQSQVLTDLVEHARERLNEVSSASIAEKFREATNCLGISSTDLRTATGGRPIGAASPSNTSLSEAPHDAVRHPDEAALSIARDLLYPPLYNQALCHSLAYTSALAEEVQIKGLLLATISLHKAPESAVNRALRSSNEHIRQYALLCREHIADHAHANPSPQ